MSAHRWPAPGSPSSLRHPARGLTPTGSRGRPDGRAAGSDAGRHAAPLGTHSGMSAPTRQPTTAQRPPGNGAFSERSSLARIAPRRSCRPICGRDTNVRRTRRSRTSVSGTALIRPDRVRPREPIPHVKRPWVGGRALSRCIGGGGGGGVFRKSFGGGGRMCLEEAFGGCWSENANSTIHAMRTGTRRPPQGRTPAAWNDPDRASARPCHALPAAICSPASASPSSPPSHGSRSGCRRSRSAAPHGARGGSPTHGPHLPPGPDRACCPRLNWMP